MKNILDKEYLKGFIFKQKCIPWFLIETWHCSSLRAKFYECKASLFNTNTAKYWERVWKKDCENIPDWRYYPNKYNKIITLVPNKSKVLDVGCGLGILMERLLKEKNCHVVGVDISKKAVEYVKSKGMVAKVVKIPPIPFKNGSFDVVIATEFLEHFRNPLLIFDEILKVLKHKGMFLFSVPENQGPDRNKEHLKAYTKNSLKQLITKRKKNFKIITIPEENGWHSHLVAYGFKE